MFQQQVFQQQVFQQQVFQQQALHVMGMLYPLQVQASQHHLKTVVIPPLVMLERLQADEAAL